MKRGIVLFGLVTAILFNGCESSLSGSNFQATDRQVRIDSVDFLALGDSYTVGQSVDPGERWPNQLVTALKNDGYRVRELRIIARTGWTTTDLLNAIEAADLKQYNLVSLLIGVNNQFQQKPFELFEIEFQTLLDKAILLAGGQENVFVVSIPDYGVTSYGTGSSYAIAMELNKYNDYMEERCADFEIPFVNVTSISRMMGDDEGALAPDNLHPSGEQYKRWVEVIYPVVREILEK